MRSRIVEAARSTTRGLTLAGTLLAAGHAGAGPVVLEIGGARFDFSTGVALVQGAGAADLHAPNAQIARVGAERKARAVAARRLVAAIAAVPADRLGCRAPSPDALQKAAAAAPISAIDWSSDGSVSLTLAVPFAALVAVAAAEAKEGPAAIVVAPKSKPTVLATRDGACVAAPRFFATLAEARAAGGELGKAAVVDRRTGDRRAAGGAAAEAAPARVVAIVVSDDDGTAAAPTPKAAP